MGKTKKLAFDLMGHFIGGGIIYISNSKIRIMHGKKIESHLWRCGGEKGKKLFEKFSGRRGLQGGSSLRSRGHPLSGKIVRMKRGRGER